MGKAGNSIFTFTNEMYGLPDSAILGENGKPQEHVLRQALNMSRIQGKIVKKKLLKQSQKGLHGKLKIQFVEPRHTLINQSSDPGFRNNISPETAIYLEGQAKRIKNRSKPYIAQSSVFMGDWNLITLHKYAPEIWEEAALNKADEDAPKDQKTVVSEVPGQTDLIIPKVANKAASELENWEKLPDIKKTKLAEACFALGSHLDMSILNALIVSEPALLAYYTLMIKNDYNQGLSKTNEANEGNSDNDNEPTETTCEDPEYFYSSMQGLLAQAQKAPRDAAIATEILLLAQTVNDWFEDNPQGAPLLECMGLLVSTLYALGHDSGLSDFSSTESSSAFSSSWHKYFSSNDAELASEGSLVEHLNAGEEIVNRLSSTEKSLAQELEELRKRLESHSNKPTQGRLARRKMEDEADEIQLQLQERKIRRREAVDEIFLSLLPPGSSKSDLDIYEEIENTEAPKDEVIPDNMRIALFRVHSYLESGTVESTPEPGEENDIEEEDDDENNEVNEIAWEEIEEASEHVNTPVPDAQPKHQPVGDLNESIDESGESDELAQAEKTVTKKPALVVVDTVNKPTLKEARQKNPDTPKSIETESFPETPLKVEAVGEIHAASLEQLENQGEIDNGLINQALIKLLSKDKLEIALNLSIIVEERGFARDITPARLLNSAYYGRHNWAFGGTLNHSLKILATFTPAAIDKWCDLPDAGKAVPYIIFASCFKPAMFGGNYSNAPSLLASITQYFTGPTARLIEDTITLANQNKLVTLNKLKSGGQETHQYDIDYKQQVDLWAQKLKNTKRGYAPILKAQSYCVEKGIFKEVIEIIRDDNLDRMDFISQFVTSYGDRESTDELLDKLVAKTSQYSLPGAILVQGRGRFFHKVSELVEISQAWISKAGEESTEVEKYCQNFSTLLPQVIKSFRNTAEDESQPIDRRAGASLVVTYLEDIRKVLGGNDAPIWEHDKVRVWVNYPETIVQTLSVETDPVAQLSWYLSQIDTPTNYFDLLTLALENDDASLGHLIYMYLRDAGDDRKRVAEELEEQITKHRSTLRRTGKQLENKIDIAVLSLLIKPDRGESLVAELEVIQDAIDSLRRYSPTTEIQKQFDDIEGEITRETASKLHELTSAYQAELEQFQASISEPIPEEWIQTMEDSISDANLPVIDEMLDEIQTARREGLPIKFMPIEQVQTLGEFLAHEEKIFRGIKGKRAFKTIWSEINESKASCYGINFSNNNAGLKDVIESFCSWNSCKSKPALNASVYENIVIVLEFLGLEVVDKYFKKNQSRTYDYHVGDGFISLYVKVKSADTRRPFPVFGGGGDNSQRVIIAIKEWSPAKLESYMQSVGLMGSKPIFISGIPIGNDQRNQFSSYFKSSKSQILHVDLVMALFLATLTKHAINNSAIRNFLWLTLPWTYFNPYVGGDNTFPPPIEMRYGRVTEVNRLLEMNNGHAIVFGGRQLGKSTIVQEVKRHFDQPRQKQFAFYHLLDKNMDRMGISRKDWDSAREVVWQHIYNDLSKTGIVKNKPKKANAESMAHEVETALLANPDHKIIVIFDEIDPILNVDNAHDFGIFRGIRELVSKPGIQGRFKLIIAGLENVKRFENSPNYPLQQLGASLQVSILSTQDALHLIREPLFAAGYTFESAQVANRILSITNRHPGIIQVFCHELISSLANSKSTDVGSQVITDEDITTVQQKQEVTDLIRTRFDMTLNLDRRYLVIIYGLLFAKKATRPFSAKDAHQIASSWLPEEFEKLGVKQFETFLTELCGLGVLKAIREGNSNQYVLRNTNILKLIGDDNDEIIHKLSMVLTQHSQSSPLDRHAFFDFDVPACPINFRDEKELLGTEGTINEDGQIINAASWKYTTTIVVGSEALGISELESTLPHLYDSEKLSHPDLKPALQYELFDRSDADFESPRQFESILEGLLTTKANKAPMMLIVRVMGYKPITHFLGMLDAAHGLNDVNMDKKYPVRVIFSMSPKAYWQWLSHPQLTDGREQLQPFINLGPWNTSAISHFLNKLKMGNTPGDIDRITDYSKGWYLSLDILRKLKLQDKGRNRVPTIPSKYTPLMEITPEQSRKFLQATGIKDVSWAETLIRAVVTDWKTSDVSYDDIQLSSMECVEPQTEDINIMAAINWLSAMNILLRTVKNNESREAYYRISPSILHAMDAENAE